MRNLNLISLSNFVNARGAYYGEYGRYSVCTEKCIVYITQHNFESQTIPKSSYYLVNFTLSLYYWYSPPWTLDRQ